MSVSPSPPAPSVEWSPPADSTSAGDDAIELAASAGLFLDPWQQRTLRASLGERVDPVSGELKWAAFEVGVVVPRQNGKNAILEARELAGLFLFGEKLILHSAHQFDTALEAFLRIVTLIESSSSLMAKVKRVPRSHGEEGVELRNGARLRFKARTKGGGRGFSGDLVVLDEAMHLPESAMGALMPTLSARPNPQLWYTGSAVDQRVHDQGRVLTAIRARGRAGGDPSLAYTEYAVPAAMTDVVEGRVDVADEGLWPAANPALGHRLSLEHTRKERRGMDRRTFAVERLGIGDWPPLDDEEDGPIAAPVWARGIDPVSMIVAKRCFGLDVSPDRAFAAVGVAGYRADGLRHVEQVGPFDAPGTSWVVDRLVALSTKWRTPVVIDTGSAAGSFIADLRARRVDVIECGAREYAQACGRLFDAASAIPPTVRHLDQAEMAAALRVTRKRALADAFAWDRKGVGNITPVVAVTLAAHGSDHLPAAGGGRVMSL